MTTLSKKRIVLIMCFTIIIFNLLHNLIYLITYKLTWGMPMFGGRNLFEVVIYDYLLGPGIYNFELGYPKDYLKLKILLWSIALFGAVLYYFGKKLGRQILTICFSIYILFLIFLLLEILPDMKEYYVSHFVLISFYNSILLAVSVYVVYALNWAKGDKIVTT